MPEATSPRKRALMPVGKLRQSLRAHGHALDPLVQIGKGGITEGLLKQLTQALADHELVKVRLGTEGPVDRYEVADRLGEEPGVNVVQILGRVVLLYKRHPKKPRFEGKAAAEAAGAGSRKPTRAAR